MIADQDADEAVIEIATDGQQIKNPFRSIQKPLQWKRNTVQNWKFPRR
jgi:hypothetical protein